MEYEGIKVKEITESQIFDPPRKMLVWDSDGDVVKTNVCAIVNRGSYRVITECSTWKHCAEIPEVLATHRELARWLAEGKGQLRKCTSNFTIYTCMSFDLANANEPVSEGFAVSKWDDKEWHKPTREYLGLED